MGLRVSKYRKEVESLWQLSDAALNNKLESLLSRNRLFNVVGEEVTNLEKLSKSPPQTKKDLGKQGVQGKKRSGQFRRYTSGTTGEPTHVSLSRSELGKMLGVRDYCFRHHGVKLGEREGRLWGRRENSVKHKVKNFLLNR